MRTRLTISAIVVTLAGAGSLVSQAGATSPTASPPPAGAYIVNNDPTATGACSLASAPGQFPTIQLAVNAAPSNGTVYVCPGTYTESVSINKPLTLDGAEFGQDARSARGPEAVVTASSGITYAAGATSGTIDGLTLNGYTAANGGLIYASNVGSGWTFTNNIIDASHGAIFMNTNGQKNPPASTVADNKFTQSTPSAAPGYDGTAVSLWGNTASNVTIADNDLIDLSGTNGGINTTQGSNCGPSVDSTTFGKNLTISGNHFTDSGVAFTGGSGGSGNIEENFAVIFCTTNAQIVNNTVDITDNNDPNGVTPIYLGGGDWSTTVNGNMVTGHGVSGSSGVGLNSDFYAAGTGMTITNNTISGFLNGIKVRDGAANQPVPPTGNTVSYFTISSNTITGSAADGINISDGLYGTISGNKVSGSATHDCEDDTTGGSGTAGTDNTWTGNSGPQAPSPPGICSAVGAANSVTVVSGSPQSATVATAYAKPFEVVVKDSSNNPVPGVTVTFTAVPHSSASGTFSNGTATTTEVTDANGQACTGNVATPAPACTSSSPSTFTANHAAQTFTVTATVSGVPTPATFALTNTSGPIKSVKAESGTPQSAKAGTKFAKNLQARGYDQYGNPKFVNITFTAPSSGPSGTFSNGKTTITVYPAAGSVGLVSVPFTANSKTGSYTVTATSPGATTSASFALTNT